MLENIQDIGRFNYLWTIVTGKNRQIDKIIKQTYSKDKYSKKTIFGDFIITIGKKAVILTKLRNGRRETIIVRKWQVDQKIQKEEDSNYNFVKYIEKTKPIVKTKNFIDSTGYKWKYFINKDFLGKNEFIDVYKPNGKQD